MEKFVEIINRDAVIPFTDVEVEGISASTEEWKKHNIYPNNCVVGTVIGEGMSPEGKIFLLQCLDDFFVTILPYGVKYILESEFWERLPQNLEKIKDVDNKNKTAMSDYMMRNLKL